MKNTIIILFTILFFSCSEKEQEKTKQSEVSMIEIEIIPSFWFPKKIVVNVKQNYLLYKNLSSEVNEEVWVFSNVASENLLVRLTPEEMDSLIVTFSKIPLEDEKYISMPDGTDVNMLIVYDDKKMISTHTNLGINPFCKATLRLIDAKSTDVQVKKEISRFLK